MKIAIMGAGMAGAYLYRLLHSRIGDIDLFDVGSATHCGISPCAWGTSKGFEELVRASGLDPAGYVLNRSDHLMMDGMRIKVDLTVFDKQRLIKDLLQGARVSRSEPDRTEYDRIIDATGAARAFLPPIRDDIVLTCVQYRVRAESPLEHRIKLGKIGYAWSFPLSCAEYHIGCGCLLADARGVLKNLGWMKEGLSLDVICSCTGKIRLTGVHRSGPVVESRNGGPEVWGVGESIGCVAPLTGDGIVSGMRSAQILIDHWNDRSGYEKALFREFRWMDGERRVMDKLRRDEALALKDALILKRNSRRIGVEVPLKDAALFLGHLR